jgi:FkbM family methyltransferase
MNRRNVLENSSMLLSASAVGATAGAAEQPPKPSRKHRFTTLLATLAKPVCRRISVPLCLPVKRLGLNMKIPLGGSGVNLNDTLSHFKWAGSWKANVFERLVQGSRPIFVDVGANIGQTLLEIFATHPDARYVGFEPILPCVSYLASVIQANEWETATILASALAAEEGVIALYRHSGSITDSCATVYEDLRPGRKFDRDWVPCLRFDTVREKLNLNNIDMVKIDVEGAELDVIKGMEDTLNSIRPIVLCEVLFSASAATILTSTRRNEELMRRLTLSRYTVWQLLKSEDLRDVKSIRPVAEFPRDYWNPANAELCDYLFLPKERDQQLVRCLC